MNAITKITATPTLGQIALARIDADAISHELFMAEFCTRHWVDMDQHQERIATAQKRLGELARRLGYDITPREKRNG